MTRAELIEALASRLADAGIESSRFEAGQMVSTVAGRGMSDAEVTDEQLEQIKQMVNLRLKHQPLQYILGEWEFCGFPITVGNGVLIPRQDTETLVETAIPILKKSQSRYVLDLCAGSGCIGIALAKLADAKVTFVEKSGDALKYLKKNLQLNGVSAKVLQSDVLLSPHDNLKADMIVCNPPYIRSEEIATLQPEVRFEPTLALDGGEDGLIFYRSITEKWKTALNSGGYLVFEIGFDQRGEVCDIMRKAGFRDVECKNDLCGQPRVVLGHI